MNPAWKSTKRYGFCRPSWACPFYFTTVELEAEAVAKLVKRATDQQDIGYAVYDTYGGRDPLHHGWPALNTLAERKRAQSNQNPPPEPSEEEGSEELEEDDDVIITKLLGKGKASSAKPRKKLRRRREKKNDLSDEDPPDPPPNPEQEARNATPRSVKSWARDTDNWYVRPNSDPRKT